MISVKVSEKGALSVYGLQRFPVTLYAEQWEQLLSQENVDIIKNGLRLTGLKRKANAAATTETT
jgi:hypothetical protein